MKTEIKSKAIVLRRNGKSYRVAENLQISKETLFAWFKDVDWSTNIKEKLSRKARVTSSKRLKIFVLKRQKIPLELYRKAENEAKREL